jgi:hypothetical protein
MSAVTAYTSDAHMRRLHALVLDFEADDDEFGRKRGVPLEVLDRIVDSFKGAALAMYTSPTKAADENEHRFRVVAPLNRPISSKDWKPLWLAAVHAFGAGFADPSCKNVSRYYVAPSRYAHETHHWSHSQEGPSIDVDAVLAKYACEVPERARKALERVADVSSGTKHDFFAAIDALPDLTDHRWQSVRTLSFELGKWGAYRRLDLETTLQVCADRFEPALKMCDLSERNPFEKLMNTAEACASNGWRIRNREIQELLDIAARCREAGKAVAR